MLRGTTHVQEHLDHGGGLSHSQTNNAFGRKSAGVQAKSTDTLMRHLGFHHPDRENTSFVLPKLTVSSQIGQAASQPLVTPASSDVLRENTERSARVDTEAASTSRQNIRGMFAVAVL
jgi:hypothetical protein